MIDCLKAVILVLVYKKTLETLDVITYLLYIYFQTSEKFKSFLERCQHY